MEVLGILLFVVLAVAIYKRDALKAWLKEKKDGE